MDADRPIGASAQFFCEADRTRIFRIDEREQGGDLQCLQDMLFDGMRCLKRKTLIPEGTRETIDELDPRFAIDEMPLQSAISDEIVLFFVDDRTDAKPILR